MRRIYHIPNQGHTLASMLRQRLFDNGATYAACLVPHPHDTFLRIEIEADDPHVCLKDSIHDAIAIVDKMKRSVDAFLNHKDAMDDE